ncbi:MAG: hypothetical protein ACMX3H_04740 [Sodalis sp. (in: enterobacteria)]|uniref:hypothetical protein n=1 Tax=Sodalis sp. (in: enterobacteria) TaxID=1898979 RepID=UPI0039E3C16C
MVSAESALKTGGLPALQALKAHWPDGEQTLLVAKALTPADGKPGTAAAENASFSADKRIRPATPTGEERGDAAPRRGPSGNPARPPLESIANRQVTAADGRHICCAMTLKAYAGNITTATGVISSICPVRCSGWG